MTHIAKISTTLTLATLAVAAQAQSMGAPERPMDAGVAHIYGEVGYTGLDNRDTGLKLSPGMVRGVIGYELNRNFSVEGMVGASGGRDSVSGNTLKLDNMVGVFGKVQAPIAPGLNAYGRLGVARSELTANGVSDSNTGLAYGAGISYDLTRTSYLSVDYTKYLDRNEQKLEGVTLGVGFRF